MPAPLDATSSARATAALASPEMPYLDVSPAASSAALMVTSCRDACCRSRGTMEVYADARLRS